MDMFARSAPREGVGGAGTIPAPSISLRKERASAGGAFNCQE